MTDNIPELENIPPEMLIAELAKRTQASLDTLNHLLEQNLNLRVADILMPDPNSYEAEVRGVMFDIFHRAAKAMGRNSDKALKGDLSESIKRLTQHMNSYDSATHGNIQNWITTEVQEKVDPDLIPATLIMESYRISELTWDARKIIYRAYTAMATYRRTRSNNKNIEIKAWRPVQSKGKNQSAK
jgi:hypothetical protein